MVSKPKDDKSLSIRAQYYQAIGFWALLAFLFIPSINNLPSAAATGATLGSVLGGLMTYLMLKHMQEKKRFHKSTLAILAISFCSYLGGALGGSVVGYGLYETITYSTYTDNAMVDRAQGPAGRDDQLCTRGVAQQEIHREARAGRGSNGSVAGASIGVGAGMAAA